MFIINKYKSHYEPTGNVGRRTKPECNNISVQSHTSSKHHDYKSMQTGLIGNVISCQQCCVRVRRRDPTEHVQTILTYNAPPPRGDKQTQRSMQQKKIKSKTPNTIARHDLHAHSIKLRHHDIPYEHPRNRNILV